MTDIGSVKPEPEIFIGLLDIVGQKSEDCLFFDDSIVNVEGARNVGIQSYHFEGLAHLKRTIDI